MSARFLPKGYTRCAEPPSPTAKNLGRLVSGLFGESKRSLRTDHLTTKDDKNIYETHASYFKDVANYSDPTADTQEGLKFNSLVTIQIKDCFSQRAILVDKPSRLVIKNLFIFITEKSATADLKPIPDSVDNLNTDRNQQSSRTADCKFSLSLKHPKKPFLTFLVEWNKVESLNSGEKNPTKILTYFLLKFKISWDNLGKKIILKNSEETISLCFEKDIEYFKALHGLKQFTTQEGFFEKFETKELNQILKNTKKKDCSTLTETIFRAHDLESDTKFIA